VVLEIKTAGRCDTDLGAYCSPTGRIPVGISPIASQAIAGHEPCGGVVAVGSTVSDREAKVGDRVMNHHYDGCGTCRHGAGGWTQMCRTDAVAYGYGGHGWHAKYFCAPTHSMVTIPDGLSFPAEAAVSCGTGTVL